MKFHKTHLPEVYLIEPERIVDERGFFARTFCRKEFMDYGLVANFEQCNISFNQTKGTLRGMHLQLAPFAEEKLVRCTAGAIYDVVLDLRANSLTYRQWMSVELTSNNGYMLYIPSGCAHGFQTLCDQTEVFYQMSTPFKATASRGFRWNDPAFAIHWPLPISVISSKDQQYELLTIRETSSSWKFY